MPRTGGRQEARGAQGALGTPYLAPLSPSVLAMVWCISLLFLLLAARPHNVQKPVEQPMSGQPESIGSAIVKENSKSLNAGQMFFAGIPIS